MFCPKCGNMLPDNSYFCGACGENLSVSSANTVETYVSPVAPVSPAVKSSSRSEEEPKKSTGKKIALISVIIVLVAALVAGLVYFLSSDKQTNTFVCISDGSYQLLTDIEKTEALKIADMDSDHDYGPVFFSPDGTYIYFFTEIDNESYTGTLCKAECSKLTNDATKNEKNITTIASDVFMLLLCADNGSVLYRDNSYKLYCFTAENEEIRIAKDVIDFNVQGNTLVYFSKDLDEEAGDILRVSLDNTGEETTLASDVTNVYDMTDVNNILFAKTENEKVQLYLVSDGKEKNIGTEYFYAHTSVSDDNLNKKHYFISENETSVSLYNFVEDSFATVDADIVEPDVLDFTVDAYAYSMLSGFGTSESDYDALYTSCTESLYGLQSGYWWSSYYSMEEAVSMTWTEDGEVNKDIQSFIDKHGSSADEEGYILVTPTVKADLVKIANQLNLDSYLDLCYEKYKYGTTTDYEAYWDAYDNWQSADEREKLRTQLKSKENKINLYNLYCLEDGTLTTVAENILTYRTCTGGVMYNTKDLITNKVKLEDLDQNFIASDIISFDYGAKNKVYIYESGKTISFSAGSAEELNAIYKNDGYCLFGFTDTHAFYTDDKNVLHYASIGNEAIGKFTVLAEDAEIWNVYDNTLYYFCNSEADLQTSEVFGDLYSFKSESICLAKDVCHSYTSVYKDGVIYTATDYDSHDDLFELAILDSDGETTVTLEDTSGYIRLDETTSLIISDGDLYRCKKGELTVIKEDVDALWVKDFMHPVVFSYMY